MDVWDKEKNLDSTYIQEQNTEWKFKIVWSKHGQVSYIALEWKYVLVYPISTFIYLCFILHLFLCLFGFTLRGDVMSSLYTVCNIDVKNQACSGDWYLGVCHLVQIQIKIWICWIGMWHQKGLLFRGVGVHTTKGNPCLFASQSVCLVAPFCKIFWKH